MAKSKLVQVNKKIADSLVNGFKKMSDTVEKGYTSIEDAFVDRYLTKDDESIEDAKLRLKAEQTERKKQSIKKRKERIDAANKRKVEHAARYSKEAYYEN